MKVARDQWAALFERHSINPQNARKISPLGKDTGPLPSLRGERSPKGVAGGLTAEQDKERRLLRQQAKRRNDKRQAAKVVIPPVDPSAERMPWGLQLVLPSPPSVNHYWLAGQRGHRFISKAGIEFRRVVKALPLLQTFDGEVSVKITASPPDKRRRDLDNLLKSLLDALQHANIIKDDSNVVDLHIVRGELRPGGCVLVEIRAVNGVSADSQDTEIPHEALAGSVEIAQKAVG